MEIPFDKNTGEKYYIDIVNDEIETGNGIQLKLNKKDCKAFSKLFLKLSKENEDTHIHLGYDESEYQGPGFRIALSN